MSSKQIKNTRLIYNDEKNLKIYQALPAEDFKEFFMACLSYRVGDNIEITNFSNPSLYGLFMMYKDKIDYNETKWEKQAEARRKNGQLGGRPKKNTTPQPEEIKPSDSLKNTITTEFDIPTPTITNIPCTIIEEEAPIEPMPAYAEVRSLPTTEKDFISDEEIYGSDVMDFLDEHGRVIYMTITGKVDFEYGDKSKEMYASNAIERIKTLAHTFNPNHTPDFMSRLMKYCIDSEAQYRAERRMKKTDLD